jgi:hypothetical protein
MTQYIGYGGGACRPEPEQTEMGGKPGRAVARGMIGNHNFGIKVFHHLYKPRCVQVVADAYGRERMVFPCGKHIRRN